MNLIPKRLKMAQKADYTNCKDVQNYLQELVNYESLIEWARRDEKQPMSIAGLPSQLYEREKVRPWKKWYSFLIP